MNGGIVLTVDGRRVEVRAGITVSAALLNAGVWTFRRSVTGEPRGPICGMGICHECRIKIDGIAQRRACLELVRDDMEIETGG